MPQLRGLCALLAAMLLLLHMSAAIVVDWSSASGQSRSLKLDGQQQQQQQPDANGTELQEAKEGKQEWWWLAKLEPVLTLRSRKARKPLDITISMPFSLDRFEALDLLCTTAWPGVVAAAVYIPVHKGVVYLPEFAEYHGYDLLQVLQRVKVFHRQFQDPARGNCTLDMAVYAEDLPDTSDWYGYPVNAMRNLALEVAKTEMVVLLDADFLMGPFTWAARLQSDQSAHDAVRSLLEGKRLLVLPAFKDPDNADVLSYADSQQLVRDVITANSKQRLLQELDAQRLQVFMMPHHADTDYERWRNASAPYQVEYAKLGRAGDGSPVYEPYIMALRRDLPRYDERFRGFFKNKVSYLFYLDKLGFTYHVCPDAYVLHYPHVKQNIGQQMQSEKHEMMMQLWYGFIPDELAAGTYEPVVAPKPERMSRAMLDQLRRRNLQEPTESPV